MKAVAIIKELVHFETEGTAHSLWTDLPWEVLCAIDALVNVYHVAGTHYLLEFDPRYDQEEVLAYIRTLAEQYAGESEEPESDLLDVCRLAQYALEACWLVGITSNTELCNTLEGVDRERFEAARLKLRSALAER